MAEPNGSSLHAPSPPPAAAAAASATTPDQLSMIDDQQTIFGSDPLHVAVAPDQLWMLVQQTIFGDDPPPNAAAAAAAAPDRLSMLVEQTIFGGYEEDSLMAKIENENDIEIKDEPLHVGGEKKEETVIAETEYQNIENEYNFNFDDMLEDNNVSSPLDSNDEDYQYLEFLAWLPHTNNLLRVAADEFGAPYIPDQKSVAAVENFWAKDDRKKRYLSHIRGNVYISYFIDGVIDAKTCVGMLRSIATEYGYKSLCNVAKMVTETIAAAEEGESSPNNSFCVEVKNLLCGDEKPGDIAAAVKKPDSLQPISSLKNSEIFRKMKNPRTKGVSLDWSETAAKIDAASCRYVAALTNLICAIIMPAYTFDEVVALNGEPEHAIFRQHCVDTAAENTKDVVDEMCVLACLNSLVQYFSSSKSGSSSSSSSSTRHLFSAPLRLLPFDKHPIINLRGSKFFFPDEKEENVVATMSVPAHSTLILNNREKRRGKNLLCETATGITAHILPQKPKTKTKKEINAKRDPFIHMSKEDRPLLMRNVLILSGNYGWFGLTLGHTPSPDILFAENNHDGLFPPGMIRRYRNKDIGVTPLRNRHLDLRFWGVEITETMGYTSCFRIRPASLCNSNNMFPDSSPGEANNKNNWTGNVVEGSKNPFVTRMGYPTWYKSEGLGDIFGKVELKDHVAALDNTMDKFVKLVEGDQRWKANQEEKVSVLKNCIDLLVIRVEYLAERMNAKFGTRVPYNVLKQTVDDRGEAARSLYSNSRRRQMCNNTESAIIAAVQDEKKKRQKIVEEEETLAGLQTKFKHAAGAISMCRMLMDECKKSPERFFDGECRIAANDLCKYIYRNSARQYIQSSLIRGVKMSVLWRRPYDECADKALADVPRCRIPQLVVGVENIEEKRRIEGKEELLLPGLQILNTRDVNPKSMHHILLSIMYGEKLAKDISAVNCLEWMNWCAKTVGEKTEEEELAHLVVKRSLINKNHYNKKRVRDDATSKIISETIHDESMPVYEIKFPAVTGKKRRRTKNIEDHEPDEDAGEEEEEKEEGAFVWPPKKRTVLYTKKNMNTGDNKMKTGRLGYKDVYIVALTSLPHKLSNEVCNVAKIMGFKIPKHV